MNSSYIASVINEIAPLSTQESWDNSGFQLDLGKKDIKRILIALDASLDVAEEAGEKHADLLITHHPLLFHPVSRICSNELKGQILLSLIGSGVSVYSSHTPFDKANGGNNDYILRRLGCRNITDLRDPESDAQGPGIGRVAELTQPLTLSEFADQLNDVLGSPGGIKVSGDPAAVIKKAAICTGGAGEFYPLALKAGADVYISGEFSHHEAVDAKDQGLCVIDAGHCGTEWLFVPNMAEKLRERLGSAVEIIETEVPMDPYDFIV